MTLSFCFALCPFALVNSALFVVLEDRVLEDSAGEVLGWPSVIRLNLSVTELGISVVKVRPTLSLGDLSVAKREFDYYNKTSPIPATNLVLFTHQHHLPPQLAGVAASIGVALRDL